MIKTNKTNMKKFRQQATYISDGKHFVDRSDYFKTKELAELHIERFACKTNHRIPNEQYKCVVFEEEEENYEKHKFDDFLDKM